MQWFHVKKGRPGTYLDRPNDAASRARRLRAGRPDYADLAATTRRPARSRSATAASSSTPMCCRASSTSGSRAQPAPSPATTGSCIKRHTCASQGRGLHPAARRQAAGATLTNAGNPFGFAEPGLVRLRRDRHVRQRHRPDHHSDRRRPARSRQLQGHAGGLHQHQWHGPRRARGGRRDAGSSPARWAMARPAIW